MIDNLGADYVREILNYDSDTGAFSWRKGAKGRQAKVGRIRHGYLEIGINYRRYMAHRLAWLYTYGTWPKNEIDHINCNRSDNRIINLRLATRQENSFNASLRRDSTSKIKGVSWHSRNKKWRAYIRINNRQKSLGFYDDIEKAHAAYIKAASIEMGEYSRYGRITS